jgi:selenide,water dikinase
MIEGTDVGVIIHSSRIPYISEAREYAETGLLPGGLHRNREFRSDMVDIKPGIPQFMSDILFDPQTSGGLLISVPESEAESLVQRMREEGVKDAAVIGEVVPAPRGKITVV